MPRQEKQEVQGIEEFPDHIPDRPPRSADEARAWDVQNAAKGYEGDLVDEAKIEAAHNNLGTPMEHRRPKEQAPSWKLVRELTDLTTGGENDSVEVLAAMAPDAQAEFAKKFFENTLKADGNPSVEAVRTYQAKFAGTPFGDAYKALVQENYRKRGIEQDIDTVRL